MDLNFLIPAICIGVSVLILVGVAIFMRRATIRALVWWIGLACVPVGAWLAGMAPYAIDAWNRLAAWWQAVTVDPVAPGIMAGLIVGGLGIALMLISRIIPHRPRKKRAPKGSGPASGGATAVRGRPVYDSSQSTPTAPSN